ncbi:hypothetical protein [Spirobacillus cienkowskii]|uniref:hypothetical protein n=1 Tax=Spirobacillus cienkowskii TaxID=495820 RepID=UPI0030D05861
MRINIIKIAPISINKLKIITIIIHFIFSYTYELIGFIGPSITLLSLLLLFNKYHFLKILGLKWKIKHLFLFIFTMLSVFLVLFLSIININYYNVVYEINTSIFIYIIGQTLAEEIVLGFFLVNKLESINNFNIKFLSIILLAIFFAILHQIFYTNPIRHVSECLSGFSLLGLFIFGFIRIVGYLIFFNISFSWAIHLGWNTLFLPLFFIDNNGINLSEPSKFNLIFSQKTIILNLTSVFVVIFLIYYYYNYKILNQKIDLKFST